MNLMRDKKGQASIEAVLLLTISVAVIATISQSFQTNNYFASLIEGPWDYVDGMIRDGVWIPSSKSSGLNPNLLTRHQTMQGVSHSPNAGFDENQTQLVQ